MMTEEPITDERIASLRRLATDNTGSGWGCSSVTLELLAEIDRLRAAVEAVKALPRLMQEEDCMRVSECGYYIDRGDVLRILEGE